MPRFDDGHAHKPRRDTYGFALRSQFVQTYKEHAHIYQEEEGERSHKWKDFLEHVQNSSKPCSLEKEHTDEFPEVVATEQNARIEERQAEPTEQKAEIASESGKEGNVKTSPQSISRSLSEVDLKKEVQVPKEESKYKAWDFIRPSLSAIEIMMSVRVRKQNSMIDKLIVVDKDHLPKIEEVPSQEACEDSQEDDLFLDAANESSSASNEVSNGMKVSREEEVVDNGVSNSVPADDKTNEVPDSMNASVEEEAVDNDVCNNVPDGDQTKEVSNDMKVSVEKEVVNNGVCNDVSADDQTNDVSDGIKVSGGEDVADKGVCDNVASDDQTNDVSDGIKVSGGEDVADKGVCDNVPSDDQTKEVSDGMQVSEEKEVAHNGVCNNVPAYDQTKEVSDGMKVSEKEEVADNGVCKSVAADDQKKDEVANGIQPEPFFPWKQEFESLVHGGVPRDLRGEVWQAFVGVKTRRVEKYYYELLAEETDTSDSMDNDNAGAAFRKWRKQIEKDIPRTFPGHPALDENGRNSLRRLLIAYARHNPSVGYCQAMNFFAGLLLLMMPEENAFWTFVGIIDDYFSGYYTEEMIESQVDQLVFEDLAREKFPKLVNHLDYLGVQVTWIIGPWFLSIFVNMIPWESVIRVWDVILFEGNRVMLFRTALALLELYGPAVVATKDAGDAITLMQSLVGSTFDSSQLVLTACMGFLAINETKLKDLRDKHRPTVLEVVEERARAKKWMDSKGLSKKLYSFKHDLLKEEKTAEEESTNGDLTRSKSDSSNVDDLLDASLSAELDSLADPQDQVHLLKVELCKVLEEKRFVLLRSEELETALMEMVKLDNRRELTARIEKLERDVVELRQSLNDKTEQEAAVMKVLKLVEQEQEIADDARISAEQEAIKQKHALCALQENYDNAMSLLAEMEKKVKVAESMLEATLQYESGQAKAVSSPRSVPDATQGGLARKIPLLSFRLGWGDRKKGSNDNSKPNNKQPPREETAPTPEEKTGQEVQEHVEGK